MEFFKSIIGPKTIKALTDGIPKFFKNLLATKASASEHKDNKNDIPIIITIANISALKVISQLNNSIAVTTKKIDEAAASGNEADIPAAQAELADLIQHSDIRIDGTFKFDIILLVVNALIIVLLYYIVRKTIILPVKKAKDDLDIIIKGIEKYSLMI